MFRGREVTVMEEPRITAEVVQQWAKELNGLGQRIGKRFVRAEPRRPSR